MLLAIGWQRSWNSCSKAQERWTVGKKNFTEAVFMCVLWFVLTKRPKDFLGILARVSSIRYYKKMPSFNSIREWDCISSSHSCARWVSRGCRGSGNHAPSSHSWIRLFPLSGSVISRTLGSSIWLEYERSERTWKRFCKPGLELVIVQNPVTWLHLTVR